MKKIKILRYVGAYVPGQVIDVEDELADMLCHPVEVFHGEQLEKIQKAVLVSDLEKLEAMPVDLSKMTAKDMHELGLKNIVPMPEEPGIDDEKVAVELKAKLEAERAKAVKAAESKASKGGKKEDAKDEEPKK